MDTGMNDRKNGQAALGPDDALERARRATANASSGAAPDPEVAPTAQRRQFSSAEKHRILAAADACHAHGEIGALLVSVARPPS